MDWTHGKSMTKKDEVSGNSKRKKKRKSQKENQKSNLKTKDVGNNEKINVKPWSQNR